MTRKIVQGLQITACEQNPAREAISSNVKK